MALVLDTSAYLKLFVAEEHADITRRWVAQADEVLASTITFTEAHSAVARRTRASLLSAQVAQTTRAAIATSWKRLTPLNVDVELAAELATRHGLRALDSIHLATALTARAILASADFAFCSFDRELNEAAKAEGLRVLEPPAE